MIPEMYKGKVLKASWIYCAKDGAPFGVVGRYQNGTDKKDIVPFFKGDSPNWQMGIDLNPRPLFGLEKLVNHSKEKAIFVVEGEKSAAALQSIGCKVLTSLGGSKSAGKSDWTPLSGFNTVYLLPDNDEPGEYYIKDVFQALSKLPEPPDIKVLRFPELQKGGDIVDWLQGGNDNWDGYSPIDESLHQALREKLKEKLAKIEPVPKEWNITVLAGSEGACFDERKPAEIKAKNPPVPILSEDLIPEPYRPWLADVSDRMQTPPDFATVSALVITGSIIGSGCSIKPKAKDDWEVIPNLWGACIGRPSVVLKSPSMKEPMQLLEKIQAKYGEQFEHEQIGAEFDILANKAMLYDIKGSLSKVSKGKGRDNVVNSNDMAKLKDDYMALMQDAEPESVRRLFKTNETSIQSMTVIQNENLRGVLTFRDELTGLLVKWDRDDGADERAYFLEGWNGDGTYTDVKIGRGLTDAKNICISLLGGIQPDKLKRYLYQAMKGNNDGLMQRLQLAVWPDEPKQWKNVDRFPDREAKKKAHEILEVLADIDFSQYGGTQSEHDERPYYRFSNAGQIVFNDWLEELQTVKIIQEENPLMVEHFGKYRSLMPSLALIFHSIDIADGKPAGAVSENSALLAVKWCTYLEAHARRIYAMGENPEHEAAVRLSEKIRSNKLSNPFTIKMIYDKGWHGLKDKLEVQAACDVLIDENWLVMTRKPIESRGRPPAPEYHINLFIIENV